MVSQTRFVVEAEIGECPACWRTKVLRSHRDPMFYDERVIMCSKCFKLYCAAVDIQYEEMRYASGI